MSVKQRAPKDLRPVFTNETIDLFLELEELCDRDGRRLSREVLDKSKKLMQLLGLSDEFWTMMHPNDKTDCLYEPHFVAYTDWLTCREVRLQLLQAAEDRARRRAERADQIKREMGIIAPDGPPAACSDEDCGQQTTTIAESIATDT
jgi:hypothetical protein